MSSKHSWDSLSVREANFSQSAMTALQGVVWAAPLIAKIEAGGPSRAMKAFLFELRFGYALHQVGCTPRYEVPGEGASKLDFGFTVDGIDWRVELMRLEETDAVRDATVISVDEHGSEFASLHLTSDADDSRQSIEGETLKAIQRICQKCEQKGQPHKFSSPQGRNANVLLVDSRAFLNGVDKDDLLRVAFGSVAVQGIYKMWWNNQPIRGVFASDNTMKGSKQIRERVHLLGFVDEKQYGPASFAKSIRFVTNPHLVDANMAQCLLGAWPLQPTDLLA